ncbi:MAG: YopX family protein [Sphaerochaeta sp.]|nr:YopX family protein [Sphaerochaeta sp.]
MREILFRAWDGKRYSIGSPEYFDDSVNFRFHHFDIDCEKPILEQFTGLVDRNGKRIFEGDIMLLGYGTKRKTVIEYDSLRAQFVARLFDKNSIRMAVSFWSAGEIIGNIHDNPELLS